MDKQKSVAVITGATRGIGRACAIALARRGDAVVIAARTPEDLEHTVMLIRAEGGHVHAVQTDISRQAEVKALFQEVDERFGGASWLVNSAAVIGPLQHLTLTTPDDWEQTLAINLTGTYLCCRYAVPGMLCRGGGGIVNITSGLAQRVIIPFGAYSVSKAGVDILTRYLAEELGTSGIRVNAISPGVVDTSMQEEIRSKDPREIGMETHRHFMEYKERGKLRHPEEIAHLVAFLTSPASAHLNGQIGGLADYAEMGWRPPPTALTS